jgi:hypothetical protein
MPDGRVVTHGPVAHEGSTSVDIEGTVTRAGRAAIIRDDADPPSEVRLELHVEGGTGLLDGDRVHLVASTSGMQNVFAYTGNDLTLRIEDLADGAVMLFVGDTFADSGAGFMVLLDDTTCSVDDGGEGSTQYKWVLTSPLGGDAETLIAEGDAVVFPAEGEPRYDVAAFNATVREDAPQQLDLVVRRR